MSSFNIHNILVNILSVSAGLLLVGNKPLLAQQVAMKPNKHVADTIALENMHDVSTQASDLWQLNSEQLKKLAQKEVNLKTFCENYPYNSRCTQVPSVNDSDSGDRSTGSVAPSASQSKSGWAIVPEASTLGLGGQIVRKITPNFNARVGVNAFGLGIDIEETEVDYEGDLSLFNVSTIIDVHPFKKSGFRVSGGLIFGDNSFDGSADISEQVAAEIEGESVSLEELNLDQLATVEADIDLNNSVAPYLGIGGGNAVGEGKGLGFWWNLGVVFGGSPDVDISSNIADEVPDAIREEAEAAADRVLEDEESELEDELDFINIYPVVSLGFSYQF